MSDPNYNIHEGPVRHEVHVCVDGETHEATFDAVFAPRKTDALRHALNEYEDRGEIEWIHHISIQGDLSFGDYTRMIDNTLKSYDPDGDWHRDHDLNPWCFKHPHLDCTMLLTVFPPEGVAGADHGIIAEVLAHPENSSTRILMSKVFEVELTGHYEQDLEATRDAIDDALPRIS